MAYYYVKNGGTATGDAGRYTTQQTGSFATLGAANYYNDIEDAISNSTTSPAAGDLINPSDLHIFSSAAIIAITGVEPPFVNVVCVDDANVDAARTSGNRAKETCTSTSLDVRLTNSCVSGIEFEASDNIEFRNQNCNLDCKFVLTGSADSLFVTNDNSALTLVNSEIEFQHAAAFIRVESGGKLAINGGVLTSTVGGLNNMFNGGFGNGGGTVEVSGFDVLVVTGTLLANIGATAASDDAVNVRFDMCKIAAGVAFTNETFKHVAHRALFTRCSDSSAAAEYQYHLHAFGGDVDDDSAIFRNESPAFTDSGQKISYKIVTNSDAGLGSPLWFDMPLNKWSVLSSVSTDILRFYITSNTSLTDKDIYIEISYPDGTNKQTPSFLTSAPATVGGTLDLMATGTTLTADSASTWTGGLTNKYQIDVDTSGDAGADTYPIIKVYVTIPSVTIQLSMDFDTL